MNTKMLNESAENIKNFKLPRYNDIADAGLYLEQVTKYVNHYLAPLGCIELTASMISNYVKQGLISKPEKKQYGANHIAEMFFIAISKRVLSIEDISTVIRIMRETYTYPEAYNYYCDTLENILFYTFGITKDLKYYGETNTMLKDMLDEIVSASCQAIHLDHYFMTIYENS